MRSQRLTGVAVGGRDGVCTTGEIGLVTGGVGAEGLTVGEVVVGGSCVLKGGLDAMLDDLDNCSEEMSDVDTRDMDGLVLEDTGSYCSLYSCC